MPGHYLSIHVNTYINHVKTSSLLGAACLGQPYPGPMYMHPCIQIGAASSRPGAGCLGPIISLYMCIHTKWKSKRLAWGGGGFPGAALPQAAGLGVGCLGQPHYISKCLHTYIWNGTTISLPGAPVWGDLAMSLYKCICKSEYTRFPCVVGCLMSERRNTRKTWLSVMSHDGKSEYTHRSDISNSAPEEPRSSSSITNGAQTNSGMLTC